MITRRDLVVALIAVCATLGIVRAADQAPELQSSVFDWNSIPAKPTETGSVRSVVKAPTATLDQLEIHITTLNPKQASHPPHKHPNEELVILKEGTLEAYINGEWKKAGPGSVLFFASNQLHGVRNIGDTPATYHVVNWASPGMLKKEAQ